jgi:hypothetical protein
MFAAPAEPAPVPRSHPAAVPCRSNRRRLGQRKTPASRSDITDLGKIVDAIDTAAGRNDALKAYVFALRDLQHAHDAGCYEPNDDLTEIDAAQARVAQTFDALIVAQFSLDCPWQSASRETNRLDTIKSAISHERIEYKEASPNLGEGKS